MAGRSSALLGIEEEVEEIRTGVAALGGNTTALQGECVEVEQQLCAGDVALTHAASMLRTLDVLGTPRSQRRIRELKRDLVTN